MTYQDLINELQGYSSEELKQNVTFLICTAHDLQEDDELSLEEVDWVTTSDGEGKILMVV